MKQEDINNEFIRLVKILKKSGLQYDVISKSVGINESKRNNIFRNRSSATEDLVKKLYEAFPQLHDLNHENPNPPPPMIDTLTEAIERIEKVERSNKQLRIEVRQLKYILNKLIEDLRLLGEVQRIMYEGMQDPEISDAFASWPEILAKFQSSIALPDEDFLESLSESDDKE